MSASMAATLGDHYVNYYPSRDWECTSLQCDFKAKNFSDAMEHVADVLAANGYGKLPDQKAPEVRYVTMDGETVLDEVVAFNAYVHLEAMDDNHWWMKITADDTEVDVNLYTKRAKITAHEDTYRRPE